MPRCLILTKTDKYAEGYTVQSRFSYVQFMYPVLWF